MEELQAKHRKEQRDLQSKITQKKKNATKKTRKGVNDECERLERELTERQQTELSALNGDDVNDQLNDLQITDKATITGSDDVSATINDEDVSAITSDKQVRFDAATTKPVEPENATIEGQSRGKKPNRQKARMARRAAEQEAQVAAAEEEAANLPNLREQEMTSMKAHMERLHLKETFVRPDGHCLYTACAMGLSDDAVRQSGASHAGYQDIRSAAAAFIAQHPDDFAPFLEEPLDAYVKKIKDTAEWGGQLELQAIARSFNIAINVLQADGRVENIRADTANDNNKDIWLAYYRHSFGLGEHYNSLQKVDG